MLALARKIVVGEEREADSVESVFEQARQVAALLVDEDCKRRSRDNRCPAAGATAEPTAGSM